MLEFFMTFIACSLSVVAAVFLLESYRSRRKQNWVPSMAYKVQDVGNGWKSFSLRINFEEHRFLSNGEIITEIKQD